MAGRQVSIYVREEELALWRRAEQYARRHRMPVSGLILMALETYLEAHEGQRGTRAP